MSLQGKTVFVSGASRGIGLAIALRAARDGANIVVAAKTAEPHRHLPGTIHTAAQEIEDAGGRALPLVMNVLELDSVEAAFARAADHFGGVDIVVNNASALFKTSVEQTEAKRYDLMHGINVRGTFFVSKAAIPYLRRAENPHVLTMSPPLNLDARWFAGHVAYTMSKYGMSMTVLGMAQEYRDEGIAFNALWPRYGIATAAIEFAAADREQLRHCRTPAIMADAAHAILTRPARECSGNFFWGLRDQEAGWVGAEIANRDGSHDLGPLQINSWWVPKLVAITGRPANSIRWWLTHDACFNVSAARWIFLSGLAVTGDYWKAVGIYHSPTNWRQRRYALAVARRMQGRDSSRTKARED